MGYKQIGENPSFANVAVSKLMPASKTEAVSDFRYCQEFCVKFSSANFLKNGRVVGTFPMGFDLQWISILRQTKASRV